MPTSSPAQPRIHPVIPPFLLQRISEHSTREGVSAAVGHAAASAARTLAIDRELVGNRIDANSRTTITATVPSKPRSAPTAPRSTLSPRLSIYDAKHEQNLPGTLERAEGQAPTGDVSVDEAYEGLGATFEFFRDVYGRNSLDDKGLPLSATVHYDRDYDNAFWDGERMVFGDGDGEVFGRFTASLSVIAHELAHGFTQYSSQLEYSGQAGALNESMSDVFGVLVQQYSLGQDAAAASWLVGEGLFLPAVQGLALRSMIEPGTAYDDDVLGRDPQPANMDNFVETSADHGGVHINSGIPNRAFALSATTLGGRAWERTGQVWFDVCTNGSLSPGTDFIRFASATVSAAAERFGFESDVRRAVAAGWATVGVTVDHAEVPGSASQRT
ncbi:M4 family metallopeptidase [Rhodococcus sp. G-MC3]|uniref:M4 family metallopeptidase n=1 Tax=Rhodococcus sp. G-MC3 TaxID=3046209 RepID=UPI0024B93454|nr:M4 family metallopeptidase [Rhodococcus sp. G-MC3]MDJ0394135.1 M4 family metallopeptidase [Rhodococcus sp. G-MC3]